MTQYTDIVFDRPPGPEAPRFIEVENQDGKSFQLGSWVQRPDGNWAIRIFHRDEPNEPHFHAAGTTLGKDIDECAICGRDIRDRIHRK